MIENRNGQIVLPKNKRVLGVDYGRVRIGLALADPTLTIATPIPYILNKGFKKNLPVFAELIKKHDVSKIVLGLPLGCHPERSEGSLLTHKLGNNSEVLRSTRNDIVSEIKQFGTWLENQFGTPVIYQNERYSSQAAEEHIRDNMQIRNPKKVAELVDSMAASMVLYEWLQERRK